jgi:hypothetical protein
MAAPVARRLLAKSEMLGQLETRSGFTVQDKPCTTMLTEIMTPGSTGVGEFYSLKLV